MSAVAIAIVSVIVGGLSALGIHSFFKSDVDPKYETFTEYCETDRNSCECRVSLVLISGSEKVAESFSNECLTINRIKLCSDKCNSENSKDLYRCENECQQLFREKK